METTFDPLLVSVALGLLSHQVFKRFEPRADLALALFLGGVFGTFSQFHYRGHLSVADASKGTTTLAAAFLATLFTSIITYRLSPWHPLSKFPGPVLARTSKFWNIVQVSRHKHYLFIQKLHEQYGPIIRTGPNELSFSTVEAVPLVYGNEGKLRRGPYFDAYVGTKSDSQSIEFCRDRKEHSRLRKVWDRAFSPSSIQSYYSVLSEKSDQLVQVLLDQSFSKDGKIVPVNLTKSLEWMTGDAMGELGFGEDLGLLNTQSDPEGLWDKMYIAMEVVHRQAQIPWTTPLLQYLPQPPPIKNMNNLMRRRIEKRMKNPHEGDVLHYLLGEDVGHAQMKDWDQLLGNCFVVMQAGADTSTTAQLVALYHILANKTYWNRLRDEIDSVIADGELIHYDAIKSLPFLDACHNEALRFLPPFPSNIQRYVDPPGMVISGEVIPGNTIVSAPFYVLHHNPLYFSPSPDAFLPERWLPDHPFPAQYSSEPFIHNTAAFVPFAAGPHLCSGQAFAIMEDKLVIASIVKKLDVEFCEGFSHEKFWKEMGERMFVRRAKLEVVVKKRGTK